VATKKVLKGVKNFAIITLGVPSTPYSIVQNQTSFDLEYGSPRPAFARNTLREIFWTT